MRVQLGRSVPRTGQAVLLPDPFDAADDSVPAGRLDVLVGDVEQVHVEPVNLEQGRDGREEGGDLVDVEGEEEEK